MSNSKVNSGFLQINIALASEGHDKLTSTRLWADDILAPMAVSEGGCTFEYGSFTFYTELSPEKLIEHRDAAIDAYNAE